MSTSRQPTALSVVIVSDYEPGAVKTWEDERRILKAMAEQDIQEPFGIILVENDGARESLPTDLSGICPDVCIVFSGESRSARLKDHGVTHTSTDFVAVLEADCRPNREWLRVLTGALHRHADAGIASGRTTYGDETMYRRCLSLVDRSFDDLGHAGETPFVSNNGAVYRRTLLVRFPYPDAATPFQSARMRMRSMREAGIRFRFEPEAVMRHAIGGWAFLCDVRRHTGYADMTMHSKRSAREIPHLLWRRLRDQYWAARRVGSRYLRWYDWPFYAILLGVTRLLEIPGMLDAVRARRDIPHSAYR